MKKATNFSFEENYKVRSTIVVVILRLLLLELFISLISFFLNNYVVPENRTDIYLYLRLIIFAINLIAILIIILTWYFKYYIVSPHGISANKGVIFRKTLSIDIPAIRSVTVQQGIIGRIFGFGKIKLISPLLEDVYVMNNLPTPYKHANLIEEARLKQINNEKSETIIPSA